MLCPPKNLHFYRGPSGQQQRNPRIICPLLAAPSRKCIFLPKKKSAPRSGTWGRSKGPNARIQTKRERMLNVLSRRRSLPFKMATVLVPPKNIHFYKGQGKQKQGNPRVICPLWATTCVCWSSKTLWDAVRICRSQHMRMQKMLFPPRNPAKV